MTVLGIVGSTRKNGNTDMLVDKVLSGAQEQGLKTEKIYLSDYNFSGCVGCEGCKDICKCVIKDGMQEIYKKIEEADAIVLGSPTYFYNVTGITKTFLDRLYAYDMFDSEDRSVWISLNEVLGIKYAVTVAVCEQNNYEDMGYTSIVMDKTLQAVGYRVVESVKALHLFSKGEAKKHDEFLDECFRAGTKLAKTLVLARSAKSKLMSNN
ncbi:MAG: flavodoxin family protein [Clostridia bacterium]|nr:flavodoxin family protein [Clostridia bacterium]